MYGSDDGRASRRDRRVAPAPPQNQTIENNPMHSREPIEKKGAVGMIGLSEKRI
jgi:hypothetical protein